MIEIRPLTPVLGAEIKGFESKVPLDAATCATLRMAIPRYGLLVFRDLDLDHPAQVYVSKMLIRREDEPGLTGTAAPITDNWYSSNQREQGAAPYSRLQFHSDGMWADQPFEVISLYGFEVEQPAVPTTFISCAHAWRTLPGPLRARVGHLTDVLLASVERAPSTVKPLALAHPRTGAMLVYACEQMTSGIVGLESDESEGLLCQLFDHMYDPAARFDHEWRERDFMVWDNIAVQHARPNVSPDGPTRTLRKVAFPMPHLEHEQIYTYSTAG